MTYRVSLLSPDFPITGPAVSPTLRREMQRVLRDMVAPAVGLSDGRDNGAAHRITSSGAWHPRTALVESPTGWTLRVELPGVPQDAVELMAEDGQLVIRGNRPAVTLSEDAEPKGASFPDGAFALRFPLPDEASADDVQASLALGVLTVTVGRTPRPEPRRINIGS